MAAKPSSADAIRRTWKGRQALAAGQATEPALWDAGAVEKAVSQLQSDCVTIGAQIAREERFRTTNEFRAAIAVYETALRQINVLALTAKIRDAAWRAGIPLQPVPGHLGRRFTAALDRRPRTGAVAA